MNDSFLTPKVTIYHGDCRDAMQAMQANSVDSFVCDPPYGLSFMGRDWDHGVPGAAFWAEALRVAKPGAHLLAFGGTRTFHRLAVAIEDAGWEIRDTVMWVYGSGFPKSLSISKAIDKRGGYPHLAQKIGEALRQAREARGMTVGECDRKFCGGTTNWTWFEGRPKGQRAPTPDTFAAIAAEWPEVAKLAAAVAEAEREVVGQSQWSNSASHFVPGADHTQRVQLNITAPATDAAKQWEGWGTALKPAYEPIIVARKPLEGTVAANVLKWGTGALNIDGCRVGTDALNIDGCRVGTDAKDLAKLQASTAAVIARGGERDGSWKNRSDLSGANPVPDSGRWPANLIHDGSDEVVGLFPVTGDKSAARFFYCAKSSKRDRGEGNNHPTVKPTALMRYLCRLVTPPGGIVLDPFMGSGSTGKAARLEGFRFVGCELNAEYVEIARARILAQVPDVDDEPHEQAATE